MDDFLLISRILLGLFSLSVIIAISILKFRQRTGTQFYIIMLIFWGSIFVVSFRPEILDSVLNTTGLINRSQFLLSISLLIIVYLLYLQTSKSRKASNNLNQVIRTVALSNFRNEIKNLTVQNFETLIIIVAKNESKTIGNVIDDIHNLNLLSYKILVINDGSTDETEQIARSKDALVINHVYNLGIGAANKTGFIASKIFTPKIVINIDADGQHDPKYIPEIISTINNNDVDLVYASRFSKNSDYKTTTIRSFGNKFYTKLVNRIANIGLTDVTTGFRGIKFEQINSIFFIAETNFAIELAIRAGQNKLRIMEIPTYANSREFGSSQFHKVEKFLIYNINAINQIINALFRKPESY